MRKPQFGLVTGLLIAFFLFVLIRITFERYIPQLPPNKLANFPGTFLRIAVHQPVDWQPTAAEGFRRASKMQRPILFVIGRASSKLGRLMDMRVFSNWSVATEINNSFVPVRVDLDENPAWSSAIFPLSRMRTPFLEDYQIFSLDQDHRLQKFLEPPTDVSQVDPSFFLDQLIQTRHEFDESLGFSKDLSPAEQVQTQDLLELRSEPSRQLPSFGDFADVLRDSLSSLNGTFEMNGYLRMLPETWLYWARVHHEATLKSSLDRFLLSPAVDVLRGGFFTVDESHEQLDVDFAEKTVPNALMADVLAECGVTCKAKFYTAMGQRTFDMIVRDLEESQLLDACRPSDADLTTDRSATASLSDAQLSQWVSPTDLAWARENLNLGQNPQQIPFLSSKSAIGSSTFFSLCHQVRQRHTVTFAQGQVPYLSINGNALAHLLRCARIWNDSRRLQLLRGLTRNLGEYVSGEDISHTPQPAERSSNLCDYLAYADAQLQYFLATGENAHFLLGRQMLIQAIKRFNDPSRNVLLSCIDEKDPLPPEMNNPEIGDPGEESTTAQAIRLCFAYGRMVGPSVDGEFLTKFASDQVAKYSDLSVANKPTLAGYYLAAAELADPTCAFVVGPDALEKSNELFRARPGRLVSTTSRVVRPDIHKKAPGVYLVAGSTISGPYSVPTALTLIPLTSQLGVPPEAG